MTRAEVRRLIMAPEAHAGPQRSLQWKPFGAATQLIAGSLVPFTGL